MIARAVRPIISPAIIDSHGKPGTAGSTIGVDTEIDWVVGVFITVVTDIEVLTTVVVTELVVVIDSVEVTGDCVSVGEEPDEPDETDEELL